MPEGHQCKRLHGHSYVAELILSSPVLDDNGFVIDYGDLKPFKDYIDQTLDHRHLNDIIEVPTAENIARHLYDVAWKLWHDVSITVRVSETAKTWAEYKQS
jgi:6-pyruvoyltetrahydropterin/6-carboxytetrahydropterin synthase